MNAKTKTIICIGTIIAVMLIAPLVIVNFAPADAGMALCFILFFVIDPLVVMALSILAGTAPRKLWWIPILCAIAFPLFFSLAVQEWVLDLFVYSVLYLGVGALAMLGTHWGIKIRKKKG